MQAPPVPGQGAAPRFSCAWCKETFAHEEVDWADGLVWHAVCPVCSSSLDECEAPSPPSDLAQELFVNLAFAARWPDDGRFLDHARWYAERLIGAGCAPVAPGQVVAWSEISH